MIGNSVPNHQVPSTPLFLGAVFFFMIFSFGIFSGPNCPGPDYPFFGGGQSGKIVRNPFAQNREQRPCYINCFMLIFFFPLESFFPRNAKISVGGLARDQLLPGSNCHRLQH